MAVIEGTCEKRLDAAFEQNFILQNENIRLAALAGELRNEVQSLREELVTRRELISELRAQVSSSMITASGQQGALTNARRLLGVTY